MNRRAFLSVLGTGAAGMTLDPERLLWVPGAKRIFLPSVRAAFVRSSPIIGAIVAAAWEQVIREQAARERHLWNNALLLSGSN